jgi:hypothetical protein
MAESISQLSDKIREAKQELYDMGDAAKKAGSGGLFSGLGDKMSGAMQVFAGNMLTKAAGAVANLGSEIFSSVQQGVELARQGEGIRIAFERLGRGDILDGLREATHGTVTDLELMKAAVKFNDFKLPVEELGTMLAFAQQKAKDTGQSVDYMVDSIVTGLGRKSLMILDNLGLSATEVKEKMAETGDMTKAVGAIIREQMSKAGDYVETAADRAAQANVSLQNKMEELGRKFAPVEEASSQLWTSMKIGILDIIGGPLATLLNQLTEAGRLKNMLKDMNGEPGSGNTKVDQQVKKLNVIKKGGGSEYIFNSTLNGMLEDYNRQIMALDAKIKDTKKLSPDQQASKFVRDEVQKMSEQMKVLGMMRDQLAAGAKELSKPIDVKIETKGAEQNVESLKVKLIELEAQRKKAIAAGDTDLSKNLAKQISQVKSDIKGLGGTTALKSTSTKNLPEYHDFYKQQFKSISGESLKSEFEHISPLEMFKDRAKFDPENILGSKDAWKSYKDTITGTVGSIGDSMDNLTEWTNNFDPYKKKMDEMTKAAKQQQMAFGMAGQAAENLGAALAGMDDPAARAAGTVISAIANIALGFGQAVASAGSMGPWAWLAYVAAGTAALATTISTVHSLTGYAEGGMIKGNSYSGDNIGGLVDGSQFVGLNAGEVVLNASQQNMLAQNLQGAGVNTVRVIGTLRGNDIVLAVDRSLQASGRGELLTWG